MNNGIVTVDPIPTNPKQKTARINIFAQKTFWAGVVAFIAALPDLVPQLIPFVPERYHPLLHIVSIVALWFGLHFARNAAVKVENKLDAHVAETGESYNV